jgi:serine/threonine protein kinase
MIAPCQRPPVRPRSSAPRPRPAAPPAAPAAARPAAPAAGRPAARLAARAADPAAGVLLAGRYRLAELVGSGATARVWRARDERLDRDVAVKQFRERHRHGVAEARIAARVRHPNVAAVHDVIQHDGSHALVMDYYGRATLTTLLRSGRRLPPPVVAALGLQLLAALGAVHAAGVVHCDVKPANLLVGDDGRLVLIDFGIAETSGGDPPHPARPNGDVVGSPAFMAPELVRGEAPRAPADLWSLGATLYTAVEGRPPFPQGDPVPTLAAVLHDPPSPARLAGRLEPLLARLLVKEPAKRPSHDAIHALLTDAYPARPTSGLAARGLAARGLAAADLRAAQPPTRATPDPADCSVDTMPYTVDPVPAQPTA